MSFVTDASPPTSGGDGNVEGDDQGRESGRDEDALPVGIEAPPPGQDLPV